MGGEDAVGRARTYIDNGAAGAPGDEDEWRRNDCPALWSQGTLLHPNQVHYLLITRQKAHLIPRRVSLPSPSRQWHWYEDDDDDDGRCAYLANLVLGQAGINWGYLTDVSR